MWGWCDFQPLNIVRTTAFSYNSVTWFSFHCIYFYIYCLFTTSNTNGFSAYSSDIQFPLKIIAFLWVKVSQTTENILANVGQVWVMAKIMKEDRVCSLGKAE